MSIARGWSVGLCRSCLAMGVLDHSGRCQLCEADDHAMAGDLIRASHVPEPCGTWSARITHWAHGRECATCDPPPVG